MPPDLERSRSVGERRVVARRAGLEVSGVVVGSSAPARPSLSDLLRGGESLCERGVRVALDGGGVVTLQAQRLRELNRAPRPTTPGAGLTASDAAQLVSRARARLERGDVEGSDAERLGALPYPVREGSSPCVGSRRPAAVLRALEDWRTGEGYESASESDMLANASQALGRTIRRLEDVPRVAREVEGKCVDVWADWSARNLEGRAAAVRLAAREVRAQYKPRRGGPK